MPLWHLSGSPNAVPYAYLTSPVTTEPLPPTPSKDSRYFHSCFHRSETTLPHWFPVLTGHLLLYVTGLCSRISSLPLLCFPVPLFEPGAQNPSVGMKSLMFSRRSTQTSCILYHLSSPPSSLPSSPTLAAPCQQILLPILSSTSQETRGAHSRAQIPFPKSGATPLLCKP